ncbi:magnesium transporter [Candidatus Micrarchaeota archaeon]|nr:magnesium transporter [Candidatus Micrarchaeota archaeon]
MSWRSIVIQSLPLFLVTLALSVFAGAFIERSLASISKYPILILVLPAFIGGCGNISNVFAARLTSAFYFEGAQFVKERKAILAKAAPILLSAGVFFFVLALIALGAESVLGFSLPPLAPFVGSVLVSGLATITLGIIVSILVAWRSFKRRLDPDNFEAPILSTFSDLVGVMVFLNVSRVLLGG